MQPALPIGPNSWAQVLTDWRVSRAFDTANAPRCFEQHPELAAPFVAEIGAAIRDKQLQRRPLEVRIRCESVVEPTHETSGGADYLTLRNSLEAVEAAYLTHQRARPRAPTGSAPDPLRVELDRLQADYFQRRESHAPAVARARRESAQAYWSQLPASGLDDGFFADASLDSAASRLSRSEPAWWWRSFFRALQTECAKHHSADGVFLDVLPLLRADATKKTLAALIAEWTEARAEEWGWAGPGHYRMLATRAEAKASTLAAWFDLRAPGYRTDPLVCAELNARLRDVLARTDPLPAGNSVRHRGLSEHWRN